MRKCAAITFTILLGWMTARAQSPNDGFILEAEANRHLIHKVEPVYPPVAKAAHVQGDVLLHIFVDPKGDVTRVEAVGGPEMLRASATAAVKQWQYLPFEQDGHPAAVKIVASIPFSLGIPVATAKYDEAISHASFPLDAKCRAALAARQYAEAKSYCADALAANLRFPDEKSHALEIRAAYLCYGRALLSSDNRAEALKQFQEAVRVASTVLTPIDEEYATTLYWQAYAEATLGQTDESERDFVAAEDSFHRAIANLPDMKEPYDRDLAQCLVIHSFLALRMGRKTDAIAMQTQAEALNPHALDGIEKAKP
jgi:TonB family protein